MKNILCYLLTFFLFSCEAVDWHTTLEQNDNAQQILDQLNDPELKKGKIFVLSRHKNDVAIKIRVNEEVFIIRREEIQSFELKEGKNSLFTYLLHLEMRLVTVTESHMYLILKTLKITRPITLY